MELSLEIHFYHSENVCNINNVVLLVSLLVTTHVTNQSLSNDLFHRIHNFSEGWIMSHPCCRLLASYIFHLLIFCSLQKSVWPNKQNQGLRLSLLKCLTRQDFSYTVFHTQFFWMFKYAEEAKYKKVSRIQCEDV